jgi:hypothetical protein
MHTNKTSTVNTKKRFGYDLNLTGFPAIISCRKSTATTAITSKIKAKPVKP